MKRIVIIDEPIERFDKLIRCIHIQALKDRKNGLREVSRYFESGVGAEIHRIYFGDALPDNI